MGVMSVHFTLDDMAIFKSYIIIIDEWEPYLKAHYFSAELICQQDKPNNKIHHYCLPWIFFFSKVQYYHKIGSTKNPRP